MVTNHHHISFPVLALYIIPPLSNVFHQSTGVCKCLLAVPLAERLIAHAKPVHCFDECDDRRDECPEEQQVYQSRANLPKIEFMKSDSA